jgi:hydroxymethylpyrimidine kinase/phosphomethylpyrimidine kinase
MVSTSGSHLLPDHAVNTLIQQLLPITTILTPNIPEAKALLETAGVPFDEAEDVDSIVALAKAIQGLGSQYVLLKGGHLPLTKERKVSKSEANHSIVLNVLYGNGQVTLMETPYLTSKNTHGTGCSLACIQRPPYLC